MLNYDETCYINGCKERARWVVMTAPIGSQLKPCNKHLDVACSYLTSSTQPAIVGSFR